MALHLIYSASSAKQASSYIGEEDIKVYLADGIYHANNLSPAGDIFVLTIDAQIRGIDTQQHQQLDYSNLVALMCKHSPIVSWNS